MVLKCVIPTWIIDTLNMSQCDKNVCGFEVNPLATNVLQWGGKRVKFAQTALESAVLQREALWLTRLAKLECCDDNIQFLKQGIHSALITKYIEGESLSSFIAAHSFSSSHRDQVLGALCVQVKRLHQLGIVHGDIKPSNILLTADDSVCLIDFANARRIGMPWSERGVELQSICYSSPQRSACASPHDDLYALVMTINAVLAQDSYSLGNVPQYKLNHQSAKEWLQYVSINDSVKAWLSDFITEV
ncbi:protein kinase family protein [Vibrio sp. SM6]|uniref:Protein kinase family protein n=1 Tax=Vibrio agarilyticus TaxID=2726741 RepID=A0A7X8YFK7_9VIBR|nr:lipopolysaccharide kinase InaA family protein [Vibrio agarilyticus]NLS11769.1 protein kinase family protein [Vibrio agarilyticus]